MRYGFAILAILLCAAPALAVPQSVSRILRSIDFEERQLGNAEDLPMHWTKVEGEGLPHYVNGRLATDQARSGGYSFRFDLNGGGLIYRYDSGQIAVQRGAHYRVECYVRTTVLPRARARITAYFTDVDHRPLLETVTHSELYAAQSDDEGWKHLAIELSTPRQEAAFLVMELSLLQPEHYAPTSLGERALFTQDIYGHAWFDDVKVSQVPKVAITTDRPGNVLLWGEKPRLQVHVNDRFTDDLVGRLVLVDAEGKVVYQRSGALDMSTATQTGPGSYKLTILLPDLRPGWYRATMQMTSHGESVGNHVVDLVQLADATVIDDPDDRFGIIATDLPFAGWDELPDLLPYLAAGRVKLAVWNHEGNIHQADPKGFDHLLERLADKGITPTACLVDLPPDIARQLSDPTWQGLLKAPKDLWQPQLAHLISRHAEHLEFWQLAADGSDAFVTEPQMRQVYAMLYSEFATLIQRPDLAMPWVAWYEMEGRMPATVALAIPPSVLPSQLPLYMQDIRRSEGHNLSLTLQLLDRQQYGRRLQIRDLAQRVVYALAADAKRIDIPLPFDVHRNGDELVKQPKELLMIVRTLTQTLGGTQFKGKVPIAEGVEAFLFEKDGKGILVLWNQSNDISETLLQVNLGQHPVRMDLWGNATPLLRPRSQGSDELVALSIDDMPIFLIDIDANLAQMRASVGFDRPLIESSFKPHTRRIHFSNPYRQAISGTMRLRAPAGWTINPPTFMFSLNPGESFERDVTIELPYNTVAGPKTVQAEFQIQADRAAMFSVPLVLNVGLSDVGMQTLALRDGNDIIVQQMISNYGNKPIDYSAFAMYPGEARQERLVTNLAPGQTTIRRYRFPKVKFKPGATVRSGIKEIYGTRILNDEVPIQ